MVPFSSADRRNRSHDAMECKIHRHEVKVGSNVRDLSVASSSSQNFPEPLQSSSNLVCINYYRLMCLI